MSIVVDDVMKSKKVMIWIANMRFYCNTASCLREATAGQGDCNGGYPPHLPRGSGRSSQEHEVRQSSGIRQHPPRIPGTFGTKSEEMASNKYVYHDLPRRRTSPRAGELDYLTTTKNNRIPKDIEKSRKRHPVIDQRSFSQCVINCWRESFSVP